MAPCRKGKQILFFMEMWEFDKLIGAVWGFSSLSMAFGVCEDKVSKL